MKKKELYSILMICLLMFSSCLGDTNTRITVGEQEAVYQSRPTKGFYVDGGRFLYGSNLSVTGDTGEVYFDIAFNPLLREDILICLLPASTNRRLSVK